MSNTKKKIRERVARETKYLRQENNNLDKQLINLMIILSISVIFNILLAILVIIIR